MYLTSARRLSEVMEDPRFYADAKRAAEVATEGVGPLSDAPRRGRKPDER